MNNVRIDPNGFWDKRNIENGKVIIPSNRITMKGVNFPVLGVSDTGDTKLMFPNGEYKFNGNNVTEYKMKNGGNTTIGNTSFDMMDKFKKTIMSPEYVKETDENKQVMQNGGWLNVTQQLYQQEFNPIESFQYDGIDRKRQRIKNDIDKYNEENWGETIDNFKENYGDIFLYVPENIVPQKYQDMYNLSKSEDVVNNISNQFYGSTFGIDNVNLGTFAKNMINGNEEIQTTKPRTGVRINWDGVVNGLGLASDIAHVIGNWKEDKYQEEFMKHYTDATNQFSNNQEINDHGEIAFNPNGLGTTGWKDQTEVQHYAQYGGRTFEKGGVYHNVTLEELKKLRDGGIKYKII